eukprot:EG_transcript_6372
MAPPRGAAAALGLCCALALGLGLHDVGHSTVEARQVVALATVPTSGPLAAPWTQSAPQYRLRARPVLRPSAASAGWAPGSAAVPVDPSGAAANPIGAVGSLGWALLAGLGAVAGGAWLAAVLGRYAGPARAVHPAEQRMAMATVTGSPAAAEVTDALAEENRLWTAMLAWLVRDCQARPAEPPVAIAVDSTGVRGLVATRDILPNELVLSVPLTLLTERAVPATPAEEVAWAARMAVELLLDIRRHREGAGAAWGPWFPLLPQSCPTPPLQFSAEELAACEDETTLREAAAIRQAAEESWAALRPRLEGFTREDYFWALSILHSRCFLQGHEGRHTIVPGIDMANHTLASSCYIAYSYPYSQGAHVEAEVSDAPPSGEPPALEMRAEEAGLEKGQEVTISYGKWPNEVFYLFFGFVPRDNPHDDVVLFGDAQELAVACDEVLQESPGPATARSVPVTAAAINAACGGEGRRLFATRDGLDGRLVAALEALGLSPDQTARLLRGRCQWLLARYSTTGADDVAALRAGTLSANAALSVRYRLNKKRILLAVVRNYGG